MSAAKHTAGPWRMRSTGRDVVIEMDDPAGVTAAPIQVAVVTCGNFSDLTGGATLVNNANARLIVAAPELKDRLIGLLDMLDGGAPLNTAAAYELLARISEQQS